MNSSLISSGIALLIRNRTSPVVSLVSARNIDLEAEIMRQLGVTVKFGALKSPGLGGSDQAGKPDDE